MATSTRFHFILFSRTTAATLFALAFDSPARCRVCVCVRVHKAFSMSNTLTDAALWAVVERRLTHNGDASMKSEKSRHWPISERKIYRYEHNRSFLKYEIGSSVGAPHTAPFVLQLPFDGPINKYIHLSISRIRCKSVWALETHSTAIH